MSTEEGERRPALANPYSASPRRPAVWGITLGRVGLAAAGVLAVVVPGTEAPAGADGPVAGGAIALGPFDEVTLGDADDVQTDVTAACMPAAYLWPAVPCAEPEASPALSP